jgi:hypothetical protein
MCSTFNGRRSKGSARFLQKRGALLGPVFRFDIFISVPEQGEDRLGLLVGDGKRLSSQLLLDLE